MWLSSIRQISAIFSEALTCLSSSIYRSLLHRHDRIARGSLKSHRSGYNRCTVFFMLLLLPCTLVCMIVIQVSLYSKSKAVLRSIPTYRLNKTTEKTFPLCSYSQQIRTDTFLQDPRLNTSSGSSGRSVTLGYSTKSLSGSLCWPCLPESVGDNTTRVRWDIESCDRDCWLVQCDLLPKWPKDKPKAFIYYIIQHLTIDKLIVSLEALDRYFNNKYQYPIVMFHENETTFDSDRRLILAKTKSKIFFQTVRFRVPDFLPPNPRQRIMFCPMKTIGYKHMIRFQAKGIYEQPIIRGFDYVMRLDDDSLILRPIEYDVFEYMRLHRIQYGYYYSHKDSPMCVYGLWFIARAYIKMVNVRPTFFYKWPKFHIFYNNFEISKLSFWLSDDYQKYIEYIDRLGGIYYNRWGDAPIKTIAVSLFLPRNQTHHFNDIGYLHQGITNDEIIK